MQTMLHWKHFSLILVLILAPVVPAQADCPETPAGEHVFLGVDTSMPVSLYRRPEIRELELLRVQLAWVPFEEEIRFRDQYLVDIDWVQQTSSNVDIWDGELQAIREYDAYPVALSWSDPETGQIQLTACTPVFWSSGPPLLFAFYGVDGEIMHEYTQVSPVKPSGWSTYEAVTNEEVTSFVSDTFNNGLDQQIISDVERATAVKPGHYLAQSFLFQTLEPSVQLLRKNPALFFDTENAVVNQNRIYVTGTGASARLPQSIDGVFSNGVNVMEQGHVVNGLEDHAGILKLRSRFAGSEEGYNLVFDVRPDVEISTEPCVDGRSRISADFIYPSDVSGEIQLYIEDSPEPMSREEPLDQGVYCDHDYRIIARRSVDGVAASTEEIWIPVATQGTLVRIRYDLGNYASTVVVTPSVESVLKVWNVADIESLNGTSEFYCDPPGGSVIDSIDAIANQRNSLLTVEEQAAFGPYSDSERNERVWGDANGDGSVCIGGDQGDEGGGDYINRITLSVVYSEDP